jgi:K+-transporting ATPase ATPase A chain
MNIFNITCLILFLTILTASAMALGKYMALVFSGSGTFMSPVIRPLEKFIYRLCGIDESLEMSWKRYALSFSVFTAAGIIFLMLLQMIQGRLPLNPQGFAGVRWDTALNTAVSFATNTNWQSYGGENTMSYLTQMSGLAVQNFLSAGTGMAAGLALIRGFSRKESGAVGNIWVDLTRSMLYILIPLSLVLALFLLSQGVIQNFSGYVTAGTIEGAKQTIPMGPAASQVAIKQLGTNGGGFFNANSAHPFENPTFLSNLAENFSILLIPMAFVFMFGYMIRNSRQGQTFFMTMTLLFLIGLCGTIWNEYSRNPLLDRAAISESAGNMEGKETRFGPFWSSVWSQSTTATSNGSVNGMHDSFMPISGMIQLFNMGVGEVIYGGAGVGLIGFLFYVILSMFVAGLMIGRTPEFMGKKFGPHEMAWALTGLLLPMTSAVIFSAVAVSTSAGLSGPANPSSHGLSEILYAYFSAAGNNGSAFAGLNAGSVFYNITLSAAILIGRFATIIPALAIAGSLASKKIVPETQATFPTRGFLFAAVVASVIFIMGALTFFPVLSLGPVLEQLYLIQGLSF